MGHERGDEILDVLGADVEFAQPDYRVPEPAGLLLGSGRSALGHRVVDVVSGHPCGAPGVDGLIEAQDAERRERERLEAAALVLEEQAAADHEAAEFAATPHQGQLRAESQRLIGVMAARGVKIPLSLLLS